MPDASGKYSKAISDRSGLAFPHKEMIKEWNGSLSINQNLRPSIPRKTLPLTRQTGNHWRTHDQLDQNQWKFLLEAGRFLIRMIQCPHKHKILY